MTALLSVYDDGPLQQTVGLGANVRFPKLAVPTVGFGYNSITGVVRKSVV